MRERGAPARGRIWFALCLLMLAIRTQATTKWQVQALVPLRRPGPQSIQNASRHTPSCKTPENLRSLCCPKQYAEFKVRACPKPKSCVHIKTTTPTCTVGAFIGPLEVAYDRPAKGWRPTHFLTASEANPALDLKRRLWVSLGSEGTAGTVCLR